MSSYAYGGKELASAFRTVRKNTIQVAEDIPESQYGHVAAPECHSVARMLTHIALATRIWDEIHRKQRLTTMAGLDFLEGRDRFDAEETPPRSEAGSGGLLRGRGGQVAAWVATLTPAFLPAQLAAAAGV